MTYLKLRIRIYIMLVKFPYKGGRLWLSVLSVNDETVVSRVWNHPVNRGLMCGQMIQTPICDILYGLYKR